VRRLVLVGAILLTAVVRPAAADVVVRSSVTATSVPLGESFDWVVSVDGAMGAELPAVPEFNWANVGYNGSSQEMTFINGQVSQRTAFQYHVQPTRQGKFQVPRVTVRVKGGVYSTDAINIDVTPPQPGTAPSFGADGRNARLKLVASAAPRTVVVGEPVIYTIRFYQGTRLMSAPEFHGPETPRFYVEPTGPGRTYYEGGGSDRWLVGERSTVLYPTVSGRLTIGPASMACMVPDFDHPDGIEVDLGCDQVVIDVRPLPPAPPGFTGTVADAQLTGAIDRRAIRADESVQVTFRLNGTGNLRLAALPALDNLADFEIFDRKIDDSLAVEDGRPSGTKVVRYTLLPRRPGPLMIPPVHYVTYVPGQGYRALDWPGARIDVAPGLARGGTGQAPTKFSLVPTSQPGGAPWTPARPYAGAALVLLGLAFALPRLRRPTGAAEAAAEAARGARLEQLSTRMGEARLRGDVHEFWRSAEEALEGVPPGEADVLRQRIAQARYAPGGGGPGEMDALAARIAALLLTARGEARQGARPRTSPVMRALTWGLVIAALALAGIGAAQALGAPRDEELSSRLKQAAQALAGNEKALAGKALIELWNAGAHRPGVAVDLAIVAYYDRRLGEAALWTERARRLDPRHPTVIDLAHALAQEGAWESLPLGLRARTTSGELAFLGCVLAFLGLLALGIRRRAARMAGGALFVLALGLGALAAQSGAGGEAPGRGIVLVDTPLADTPGGPTTVNLEAGRALWLEGASGGWMRVRAGSQVSGFVPAGRVRAI